MYIHEAVKEAMEKDCCITTKWMKEVGKIRPTNEPPHYILMKADGTNLSKYGWQPSAEDLMRDVWIVVD